VWRRFGNPPWVSSLGIPLHLRDVLVIWIRIPPFVGEDGGILGRRVGVQQHELTVLVFVPNVGRLETALQVLKQGK
jgi:hypothetical protein